MAALGGLADDASGLAGNDAEARNHHVGRDHGAVEHTNIVLDDGELVHDGVGANVNVGSDAGGLDNRALADKDVVAHAEGHVGKDAVASKTEAC